MSNKDPTLGAEMARRTVDAMALCRGNRVRACRMLGIKPGALSTRLVYLRKAGYEVVDTSRQDPAQTIAETVAAMEKHKGSRKLAGKELGINQSALAARLATLRWEGAKYPDMSFKHRGEWQLQTVECMRKHGGDREAVARELGISRQALVGRLCRLREEENV